MERRRPPLHSPVVLVVGAVALAASIAWARATLPAGRIPTHWSGRGADGWTDRDTFLLVQLPLLAVGLTAFLLGLGWLIGRTASLSGLNVPNRDEWARPEHREVAVRMLRDAMAGIAGIMLLLFAALPVTVAAAIDRPGQELPGWVFGGILVLFIGLIIVWVIGLLRSFASPGD